MILNRFFSSNILLQRKPAAVINTSCCQTDNFIDFDQVFIHLFLISFRMIATGYQAKMLLIGQYIFLPVLKNEVPAHQPRHLIQLIFI
ncbi:hypothetical protein D3C85_1560080 [compost metagenome]